ncbi:MAG: SDR family oxidoreductase [Candidatus Azotimanducaceae bacterium WSBS_2022_MAG_OTU7]
MILAQLIWNITTDTGASKFWTSILAMKINWMCWSITMARPGVENGALLRPRDWIKLYDINTLSIVRMVQRFTWNARQRPDYQSGCYIGSTRPNNVMPHYYAAKGALATLTVSLSKVGPGGITVNLVSPGSDPNTRG